MAVKIFCENIFDDIMPALRAIVANNLTSKYGMTQQEASKKLGLTQPAVSQYKSGLRGKKLKKLMSNPNMSQFVDYLSAEVVGGHDISTKVCEICAKSRKEGVFNKEELDPFLCLLEIAGVKK
ncbi:MAG TPA: helix-turn-helix domain-containing protein [archaeon]|nr:helix-turn-helix domain-containing protein [archaeon]